MWAQPTSLRMAKLYIFQTNNHTGNTHNNIVVFKNPLFAMQSMVLAFKNHLFVMQKGVLRIAKYPAYTAQTIYRVQNVWQQTFRNIHFLRKYNRNVHSVRRRGRFIAPVLQSNQMVLICRNDAKRNAIS